MLQKKIVKFSTLTDEAIFSRMLLKKIILNFKLLEDIIFKKTMLSKNAKHFLVSHATKKNYFKLQVVGRYY